MTGLTKRNLDEFSRVMKLTGQTAGVFSYLNQFTLSTQVEAATAARSGRPSFPSGQRTASAVVHHQLHHQKIALFKLAVAIPEGWEIEKVHARIFPRPIWSRAG